MWQAIVAATVGLCGLGSLGYPALAQVGPSQEQFPPQLLEPLPPESEVIPPPQRPDAELPQGEDRLTVRGFEVEGSTLFSPSQLQQALQIYVGRELTLGELRQAADAITQLYLDQGYITSRAVLPEQTVADGIVRLRVIEGQLAAIRVEGTERLADYVRSRVELGAGQPLNQRALEDQLRLLRADPLFDNVEASLRAGEGVGQSILTVRVEEANPFSGNLTLDTLSPRSVGQYRTGATLRLRNLAGIGDTLQTATYRSTTGGSEQYEISYQFPVSPRNATVLLRMTPNNFRVTNPEAVFGPGAGAIDLRGSTDIYEVIYRQPLVRTPREELALSAGFRYRDGNTLVGGIVLPPTTTSVFSFGQDYLRRDLSGAWGVRSQFRLGTGLFGATTGGGVDGQFFSWNGQVQRVQVLTPDQLLILQADVQLSTDPLLGSEQFYIGGQQSVRGYYQNARFGDSGLRLSVEDRITLQRDEGGAPVLQVSPFLDFGYVWGNLSDRNVLLGTGVGLSAVPIEDLSVRIDLGVPLLNLNEQPGDRPGGLRVYFGINYQI